MRIAITGHRPHKLNNDYDLVSPLIQKIECQIEIYLMNMNILKIDTDPDTIKRIRYNRDTDTTLITGMALGIDTLFAQIAVKYGIPFIAAIPFTNQANKWPKHSQTTYYKLLGKAKEIVNVSKQTNYKPEYMQLRNIWMVDNCNLLIGVWDGTSGGTANCLNYAKSIGRETKLINPQAIRESLTN